MLELELQLLKITENKNMNRLQSTMVHTEHTWGMWTSTPPTEWGSGCGTAIGTGPRNMVITYEFFQYLNESDKIWLRF